MTIDVCIPVYRNLNCLKVAAYGLRGCLNNHNNLGKLLLHAQDPTESHAAIEACRESGFDACVVSHGGDSQNGSMSDYLNRLFANCTSDWVLFMEQDTFLSDCVDVLAQYLQQQGFIAAGPLDTMHTNNLNARGYQLYGQYMRFSPEPGFFHSSLILLNRAEVAARSKTPFTIPTGFKMHGTGVLGGEPYYGLRINLSDPADYMLKKDRDKICFFEQVHAPFGYAAEIRWEHTVLATHLYFSSTRGGYSQSGWMCQRDHDWLVAEEARFLTHYTTKQFSA